MLKCNQSLGVWRVLGFMLVLLGAAPGVSLASEDFRMNQPAIGLLGGEMAGSIQDFEGFFASAAMTHVSIYKATGPKGKGIQTPGQEVPLPTGALTANVVPDGTYQIDVHPGSVQFSQQVLQLNLILGYLFDVGVENGRLLLSLNQVLQSTNRAVRFGDQAIELSPVLPERLPRFLQAGFDGVLSEVQDQVRERHDAELEVHNQSVTGLGDSTLILAWVQRAYEGRLKVGNALTVSVPTGAYRENRGANPGFNHYTVRGEMVGAYSFGPRSESEIYSGFTVGARIAYGWNSENRATKFRTGQFVNAEVAAEKVYGNIAFGGNLWALVQTTDDTGAGVPEVGGRYRAFGMGPFVAYKLPGQNVGLNLGYSDTLYSQNGQASRAVSLRLIKAW